MLKKASATLGAFLTAAVLGISTFAAFGVSEAAQTTYSQSLPGVPFESTAKIDPKTTVFLYLGEAADENLRRIFNEWNRTIAETLVAAERDAYERYLAEEEAKWEEIEKAATLEHDAVFRQIEAESKTPEEKQKRIVRFYEYLGAPAPGKPSNPGTTFEEARKRAIENETQKAYAKVYKVAIMDPQPWKRALRRAAAESWRRIEREFWPSVAEKIDWENLNLDGARFDFRPEVAGAYDSENNDVYAKFGGFFGELDGLPFCWGIPATLEQLERTKSWREKTLRDAEFYRVFTDASFVGWTFENCRFEANRYGRGAARFELTDGTGFKPEMRAPGDLWHSSGKESKSDKIVGYDACDFTDATLRNVYFDRAATITFEQFAATRSYKEDEIIAKFGFTIAGWDFSGKNVGDLLFETGMYEPELSAIRRKGGKTGWASLKLDGARFEPRGYRTYRRWLPDSLWRSSRRFREKDLSGATFDVELNGGDFSGFDLTGATMLLAQDPPKWRLDGATIRGLKFVVRDPRFVHRFRGALDAETLRSTKSWQDKDLRDVHFTEIFNFDGIDDLSGFDLRGARFAFVEAEKIDLTGAKLDGCRFDSSERWPAIRAARGETSAASETSSENAE